MFFLVHVTESKQIGPELQRRERLPKLGLHRLKILDTRGPITG